MTQTARDKIREQILELQALHEDGLLSRQEFDLRKNAILDAQYAPRGGFATPMAPSVRIRQGTEIGLMAGQEIGPQNRRYRLERLLAHGGMGQVWQATDLATEAELGHSAMVAVKILPPQMTQSALHAKLLIEEATQARRLAHEHIVRVYEWAQDPATASYFIIMECLEGEDLDSLLAREGTLPLARVQELLAPVAAALEYAWERHHLVHRDIKPANVFVTSAGDVKLLDFGIAARARSAQVGVEAPGSSGTAGYRAPEAATLAGPPARTLDVYAVAVMIYQMVAGRLPFEAVRKPARPDALNERQWEALQRGLAQAPDLRPASVAALLALLAQASGPSPEEIAAKEHAERAERERRARQLAEQRRLEAQAHAAARLAQEKARKEQEAKERQAQEAQRRQHREALRAQLQARRLAEAEGARRAQEEQQRKALQSKALAAYRAEQQRAREELVARTALDVPPPESLPTAVPDAEGVLRDRFLDGPGSGPQLVMIPVGRFQMGSPEHERTIAIASGSPKAWLDRETPQHWVGIEQPIALGRFPVTVGEWRQFVLATGWHPSGEVHWASPGFPQLDDHPVVGVTWHDAQAYCRWLSERTGLSYRLPSEAEWEYCCRAGTRTAFSFGDQISTDLANYDGNFSYNGGPLGEFRQGTTPVWMFPPNLWGLFDMHGNVWEWVQDAVHENYEGAPVDGSAWESGGDRNRRILRGGSWQYHPRYLRSALRNGYAAGLSNNIVGFRVARNLG